MFWLYFAVFSAFGWSIISVIDKVVVNKAFRESIQPLTVNALVNIFFVLVFFLFFYSRIMLWFSFSFFVLIIAGVILFLASLFYYKAFLKDELTKNMPVFGLIPIFVLMMSFVLLNEVLSLKQLFGFLIVVFAVFIISFKKDRTKLVLGKAVLLVIVSSFFFALTRVIEKFFLLQQISLIDVFFWPQVGYSLTGLAYFVFNHKKLMSEFLLKKKFVFFSGLSQLINFVSNYSFTVAISLGFVSLASVVISIQPLLVFFITLTLSFLLPQVLHENFSGEELVLKFFAAFLVVLGLILLT